MVREGPAGFSSLLLTIAASTSFEEPVLTSLFSSKPKPAELGMALKRLRGARSRLNPGTRKKGQSPLPKQEGLEAPNLPRPTSELG